MQSQPSFIQIRGHPQRTSANFPLFLTPAPVLDTLDGTLFFLNLYLLTCEVYLIEVLEIMVQMQQYINSSSLKLIKVSSDFDLNYLKKSCKGRHHSKISQTNTKTMISSKNRKGWMIWCVFALIFSPNWTTLNKQSFLIEFLNFIRFSKVRFIWAEYY